MQAALPALQAIPNLRPVILDNVTRMLHCKDPKYGGVIYGCPECGNTKLVGFSCHSRFCPSCGSKYNQERAIEMASKVINCPHRHLVFTIDKRLRPYFRVDRAALGLLFTAVDITLRGWFDRAYIDDFWFQRNNEVSRHRGKPNKKKKKHRRKKRSPYNLPSGMTNAPAVPGFLCVLHTFGRSLQWNPHIHCLCTEGGLCKDSSWKNVSYFNYAYLRKNFMSVLLSLLSKRFSVTLPKTGHYTYATFLSDRKLIREDDKDGFYVNAPPKQMDIKNTIKYIGRYLGRPVIASSRIDSYDPIKDEVCYHYDRHEDEKRVDVKLSALEFAKLLIVHIPDENFKMLRYYGLYSTKTAHCEYVIKAALATAFRSSTITQLRATTHYRNNMLLTFRIDPLTCEYCGHLMEPMIIYEYNNLPDSVDHMHKSIPFKEYLRIVGHYSSSS